MTHFSNKGLLTKLAGLCCLLASMTPHSGGQRLTPQQIPVPADFFGMHINHILSGNEPNPPTPWPTVKFGAWRLWDVRTTWTDVEPSKGQWKFEVLDKLVALARQHNTQVQLTFGFTPAWASTRPTEDSLYRPGGAADPKDIKDWDDYVRKVASRYKGEIHIYEIWNEPNVKRYWSGTPQQLAELARHAHDIIKEIDPSATIVGPSPTGDWGVTFLNNFLDAGGGKSIDVVGYHFYVFPKGPEAMWPLIQTVRATMEKHGIGDKQLWDTETGWAKPAPFPSEEMAADYLARAYFLTWASGVKRFYWYSWDNHGWVTVQTTKNDNVTLSPAGKAYDVIQHWMIGKVVDFCETDPAQTWSCRLTNRGKREWIVWNPDKKNCWPKPADVTIKEVTPLLSPAFAADNKCIEANPEPALMTQ